MKPETVETEVAPGVMIRGEYHAGSDGDRITPGEPDYVDVDSIEVTGRPDLVAEWLADTGLDFEGLSNGQPTRADLLDDLADDLLREHHGENERARDLWNEAA